MRLIVLCLFFVSGATGLVLETVWFRQLALIFGSTGWAAGTVTGAFLGGLGVGSLIASRLADRLNRRLAVYGGLELFVGLFALASPWLIGALDALQYRLLGGAMLSAGFYAAVRFGVAFAALLPATLAMGATLPFLARAVTERETAIGRRLGSLYGVNTLGAFAGALIGGFALLPILGQAASTRVAAAAALTVGAVALALGLVLKPTAAPAAEAARAHDKPLRPYVLLAFFVFSSGFTAMLIQVAMTRLLAIVLGSSVYSFTLTVAVFLAGIGLGSLVYAFGLSRRVSDYLVLAVSQGVLAGSLALALLLVDRIPGWLYVYAGTDLVGVPSIFFVHAGFIALLLFLPTLAMGAAFPAAMRLIAAGVSRLGRDVGWAYFLNTLGSIVGSFGAAFVLIPNLGLHATLVYAIGLAIFWAGAFSAIRGGFLLRRRLLVAAPLVLVAMLMAQSLPRFDLEQLTSGMFRVGLAKKVAAQKSKARSTLLYYRDGPVGSVSVEKLGDVLSMRVNGKVEASNRFDMPTQILAGLLPVLLQERATGQRAALIGYGSGVTAGAMLSAPIAGLAAVELEPRVLEAARFFKGVNFAAESDERLQLVVGDARTVLGYSALKFDVIVSEPSNPWVAGASGLFTRDFYELMRARLSEDGVYAQWVQLYEMSAEHLRSLVRSFRAVFPNTLVFSTSERGVDLVLLGRAKPWTLDVGALMERTARPAVQAALKKAGVGGGLDILALLAVTDAELQDFVGEGPLNTDDNGLIEFAAPKDMLFYEEYAENIVDFHFSVERGRLLPLLTNLGDTHERRAENLARIALHLLARGRTDVAYEIASASRKQAVVALADEVQEVCELIYLKPREWPPLPNGWLVSESKGEGYLLLAAGMSLDQNVEALEAAMKLMEDDPDPRLRYLAGALALKTLQFEAAEKWLVVLAEDAAFRAAHPEVDFFAGRALDRQMKFGQATRHLARYNQVRRKLGWPLAFLPEAAPADAPVSPDDAAPTEAAPPLPE